MLRSFSGVLLLAALALPRAEAEEVFSLQRKRWNGQKLAVEERTRTEIDAKARVAGPAGWSSARTEDRSERETRLYQQDMTAPIGGDVGLRRVYEKATITSDEVGSTKMEERPTSLHAKTLSITFGRLGVRVDSKDGKIAAEDAGDARIPEKLYELLPDGPVAVGAKWDADGAVLSEAFLGGRGSRRPHAGGAAKAAFRRIATVDGRRCAELGFEIDLGAGPVAAFLHFALEEGTIVAFEMSGPVSGERGLWPGASVEAKGKRSVRYHARIVERGESTGLFEEGGARRGPFGGRRRDRG